MIAAHEVAEEFFVNSQGLTDSQRAWLRKRGICDETMATDPPLRTSGQIRFANVVFHKGYFDFAVDGDEGASPAFVVIARDRDGVTADIVAFNEDRIAFLLRPAPPMIGEQMILAARLDDPLNVFPNIWEWLRADREGVVIFSWKKAARHLEGMSLSVDTVEFGQVLRERLGRPAPPIFVKIKARAAA